MEQFRILTSRLVPLPAANVDTDQIIPARFLKTTQRAGLGRHLMFDWRFDSSGRPRPEFILNQPHIAGARVFLVGGNFGCGSSREHAPWALADFGFRALISTSFADIFRNNCLKNGILPVVVEQAVHEALFRLVADNPSVEVTIDLTSRVVMLPAGEQAPFPIEPFARQCLLEGMDELGYLLTLADRITEYEKARK